MHISLDSALGQQRRLNQVGESITQIAPDPAAAYSLRSLTGSDPKVVRVRRGSDNDERDFTASEVSSGALVDFVNTQAIKPLDIQALTSTGRDGDFLIAKAAYSLRSLGTRQATVAATGDTVARADGKYVCQVRRGSDDTIKSFTADEVTDGTLVSFVNENINKLDIQTTATGGLAGNVTNVTSTGFDFSVNNEGSVGQQRLISPSNTTTGNYNITFDAVLNSGSLTGITLARVSDNADIVAGSNSVNLSITPDVSGGGIFFRTPSTAVANVSITNITLTQTSADGLVRTWYDQSVSDQAGNTPTGNHATQTTAGSQPKIVSAGALETDGMDFDGTDDEFDIPNDLISNVNSVSAFLVSKSDVISSGVPLALSDNSPNDARWYLAQIISNNFNLGYQDSNEKIVIASADTSVHLFSATSGTVTTEAFIDGTSGGTTSSISSFSPLSSGGIGSVNGFGPFNGHIREVIVYNSDQTDNRVAIEANIGEHYSIDLPSGVDPGFDQVDGFVETWYDQSGNGRDVTQATAANQPKIVNAGALVTDSSGNPALVGDGTDDNLINSTLTNQLDSSDFLITAAYKDELSMGTTGAVPRLYLTSSSMSYNTLNTISYSTQTGRKILSFQVVGNTQEVFANGSSIGTASEAQVDIGQSQFGVMQGGSAVSSGPLMEVLVYDSNQSAKRATIEANINGHYSIF